MDNFFLTTQRCFLTFSDKKLAPLILKFCIDNKDHLKMWEDNNPEEYYTLKYQKSLVKLEHRELKCGKAMDFWILKKFDRIIIGKVAVFGIVGGNLSSCMIGYKIDKEHEGKGYMSEAVGKVVDFLFEELNMHRIEINILPENIRSRKLAERLGFTIECLSPRFMRVRGKWSDHYRYVKINDNYKEFDLC